MTTLHGDTKALHLLHIHNALTRNSLKPYRGREVKHTGDGIMASFVSIPDAIKCALPSKRLSLRITRKTQKSRSIYALA